MRKANAGRVRRGRWPMGGGGGARSAVPGCARAQGGRGAMGGRNKKQRAGSAAHAAATATARARAAQAGGAAGAPAADPGSRATPPRPAPASKEPRVKQGTAARGAPGAAVSCGVVSGPTRG